MKVKYIPLVTALLSAFALTQPQAQTATPAAVSASAPVAQYSPSNPGAGWYKHLVNLDFVKKQADIPKVDGVMLIDSRPAARKYDIGHIPTALNISAARIPIASSERPTLLFRLGGRFEALRQPTE